MPKTLTVLGRGYGWADLRADALAGLTVAVVALPLAMALAIASGTTPDKGLHTAIVAGFLISLLGGSRVQIGGPTAAFIPVAFAVIVEHGYGGMILCTLLAGLILIAAGLLRIGALMRFMPRPVVTGFSAGIAVSIALSQVRDGLGLDLASVPVEFLPRIEALTTHLGTLNPVAALLCAGSVVLIFRLRAWSERFPSILAVVVLATVLSALLALPVETIGSRFGALPTSLPSFELPVIPFERTLELLPASLTIAFLAGVESLL